MTTDKPSIGRKIAAGSLSGAVAAGVTNPLDLVKTRMQSKGNPDKTMGAAFRSVVSQNGVKGLWRGSAPSMVRPGLPAISMQALAQHACSHPACNLQLAPKSGLYCAQAINRACCPSLRLFTRRFPAPVVQSPTNS